MFNSSRNPTLRLFLPTIIHFTIVFIVSSAKNFNILEFLGLHFSLGATIYFCSTVWESLYNTWIGVYLGHNIDLRKVGSWAIVTGATDGIGFAYCEELASRGINIVLMSRTMEKLYNCALSLESRYKIKTKVIQIDFSGDIDVYDAIVSQISGLDIGTLINNVGMTYSRPTIFHDIPDSKKFIHDILNINALSVSMMTRAVLPGMLQRGAGVIVNVGSYVSANHTPFYSLYSASKCFVEKLTEDLSREYEGTGIYFQYQLPGYVSTKLSKIKNPSLGAPSAKQYAKWGVRSIGLQKRTAVWIPHRIFCRGFYYLNIVYPGRWPEYLGALLRQYWLFAKKREMEKLNIVLSQKDI